MILKFRSALIRVKMALLKLFSISSALVLFVLPISFSASAVDSSMNFKGDVIELPFPSPSSYGESSRSFVFYNELKKRFDMYVLMISPSPECNSNSVRFQVKPSKTLPDGYTSPNYYGGFTFNMIMQPSENVELKPTARLKLYRMWWYPTNTKYSLQQIKVPNSTISPTVTTSYTVNDSAGSVYPSASFGCYNGTYIDLSGTISTNISYNYTFSGDGSISQILKSLDDIDTTLQTTNGELNSILNQSRDINTNLASLISAGNTIIFYEQEILNQLKSGSDYTPEESTTNKDMNDYENAEGALMDNNINALNNMQLPDLNSFNSGNQGNAFQFISSNIEFFSGMNGSGSISKVGSVLLVVLGLGLTSFIIGLSNRRKG